MMAKAAAPYRHPQLAAVAHRQTNADGSLNLVIQQPRTPAVEANTAEAAPPPRYIRLRPVAWRGRLVIG